ncbi:chlororespiratory reduction 6 domain-containing protein [Lamprobacter modestohalophilus]|uniref:chlororespiratory reduction 6 domain-containing protein n=1 Tax=Lamprobacter modestohalophilus TaxID=1064514 RepID=UPI002ADEA9B9|nr:chlororespiratory reduction 6 domain-containing protein [Lamprobacter modestohalophilus]MEA1052471.1 chlororespiratory reduction 6 domain-containing protein [Lamprobacter modestohalophilus]
MTAAAPQYQPRYPRARLSAAKDEVLAVEITRESVERCDIQPLLGKLELLSEDAHSALHWEGKLTFYFGGWDRDRRETAEIPEIRAYFAALTAEWPYWLHFAEKIGDSIPHVLRLLCRGHVERRRQGIVGWQFDDPSEISRVLLQLFDQMNALYDRLGLPEENNQRITEEVAQLIESSLLG